MTQFYILWQSLNEGFLFGFEGMEQPFVIKLKLCKHFTWITVSQIKSQATPKVYSNPTPYASISISMPTWPFFEVLCLLYKDFY